MKNKILAKIILVVLLMQIILNVLIPITPNATAETVFDENNEPTQVYGNINDSTNNGVEIEAATGLDTFTGILMEPTVKFFTFIADSIMSIFTSIMTQNEFEFVMQDKIENITDLGDATTIHTIPSMEPYKTASGKLKLSYPDFPYSPEEIFAGKIDLMDINFIDSSNTNESWGKIRGVISKWYQILRMIAIIGLLSVLIYTGIKIILSSTAGDKAKYKQLILNWFIAAFLAFSMHYIMAFILYFIEEITGLLKNLSGVIEVHAGNSVFKTNLIGLARFNMQQQHFSAKIGHLIIYVALIAYTVKFTFVYLKRVLYMAFLTIIAPIVALTYPIDKMNSGTAQGFEMWLKEFLYNALLQPMHYILYYILVSSSLSLAANNPLYGIAALMFISHAEKLLKKIFGFDKARNGTVGGIAGAFATGAITSALMKNIKKPLGIGAKKEKSKSGEEKNKEGNYNGELPSDFIEDANWYDFIGQDILGDANVPITTLAAVPETVGVETSVPNADVLTIPGIDNFFYTYRQGLPKSVKELGGLVFEDGEISSIDDILRKISKYQTMLLNPNNTPEQIQEYNDELSRLTSLLNNRIEANEFVFSSNGIPFQYTDGDSRSTSDIMEEIMRLNKLANNPSLSIAERRSHAMKAQQLLKVLKNRMAQNQYIQKQGGPLALLQQEGRAELLSTGDSALPQNNMQQNVQVTPLQNNQQNNQPRQQQDNESNNQNEKPNHSNNKTRNTPPVVRGIKNVGKTIIKPVWDAEKDGIENGKRLVGKVLKTAAGVAVGVTAATVQAGISITDGKYKPMEGIATVGAGMAGVSGLAQKAEKNHKKDEEITLEKYSRQWFNDDTIIQNYNREFPGQGKEMRKRAVDNYVSRGITDFKDQKQAIKFAEMLKKERGMSEEEADKIAVATLQYKRSLNNSNSYNILYDKKKRKDYIETMADSYSGAASKESVRRVHDDFIQNVIDFNRANN